MQNFSYENEFDLHGNELVGETHFHKNGFALRLVLTKRQTRIELGNRLLNFGVRYRRPSANFAQPGKQFK